MIYTSGFQYLQVTTLKKYIADSDHKIKTHDHKVEKLNERWIMCVVVDIYDDVTI